MRILRLLSGRAAQSQTQAYAQALVGDEIQAQSTARACSTSPTKKVTPIGRTEHGRRSELAAAGAQIGGAIRQTQTRRKVPGILNFCVTPIILDRYIHRCRRA